MLSRILARVSSLFDVEKNMLLEQPGRNNRQAESHILAKNTDGVQLPAIHPILERDAEFRSPCAEVDDMRRSTISSLSSSGFPSEMPRQYDCGIEGKARNSQKNLLR
jgi:hypothetical protein